MMTTPHDLISGLVENLNTRDEENLAACFTRDAVVRDGGLEYHGPVGVRRWIQRSIERYALRMRVLTVSGEGREWLFDAVVSGSFEGSPVRLEHCVTIEAGKIACLDI